MARGAWRVARGAWRVARGVHVWESQVRGAGGDRSPAAHLEAVSVLARAGMSLPVAKSTLGTELYLRGCSLPVAKSTLGTELYLRVRCRLHRRIFIRARESAECSELRSKPSVFSPLSRCPFLSSNRRWEPNAFRSMGETTIWAPSLTQ